MAAGIRSALAVAVVAIAAPCLVAADDPAALLANSWNSQHWAVLGVYGDAPKRIAILIDRDSIVRDGAKGGRSFNYVLLFENRPAYYGSIERYHVECDTMTGEALYTDFYRDRKSIAFKVESKSLDFSDRPQPGKTEPSEISRMGRAVCRDGWTGLTLLDVPGGEIGTAAFASAPLVDK